MIHSNMRLPAVIVYLTILACPGNVAPQDPPGTAQAIEGLWTGAWGGGERDGVVFQPVIAELIIKGDHVEMSGFRGIGCLTGTVRIDARAKRIYITPAAGAGGQLKPKAIVFTYVVKADDLTLTDIDKVSVFLCRQRVTQQPLANAQMEAVAASEINGAGDLLVTDYRVLGAGQAGGTYYQPQVRKLKTNQATILLAQEAEFKKVTVAEARGRIRKDTPVVLIYRRDERPSPYPNSELLKYMGPPMPDSEAVRQTLARLLRPGTLVFVLPASESVPQP